MEMRTEMRKGEDCVGEAKMGGVGVYVGCRNIMKDRGLVHNSTIRVIPRKIYRASSPTVERFCCRWFPLLSLLSYCVVYNRGTITISIFQPSHCTFTHHFTNIIIFELHQARAIIKETQSYFLIF